MTAPGSTHPLGDLPGPGDGFILLIMRSTGQLECRNNVPGGTDPRKVAYLLRDAADNFEADSLGTLIVPRPGTEITR